MSTSLTALLRAKQQELKNKTGREKTVAPPGGASRWRILPHWGDDPNSLFSHDFGQHFVKDFTGKVTSVYICTLRTFNKPCDICETMAKSIAGMSDENAKTLVGEARAQQRYLMNAVRKNDKGVYEQDVQILSLPSVCFEALVTVAAQYADSDSIDIFDPASGYDVIISREGTGPKNTKYQVMVAPKPSAIAPEYLKKRRNLDEYCAQEYEQGKLSAINALKSVSGTATPSLAVLPPAASTPTPVTGTASVKMTAPVSSMPTASEVASALEVNLDDVDLEGLEEIE